MSMTSDCNICKSIFFDDDDECQTCKEVDDLIAKLIDNKLNLSLLVCRQNKEDFKSIERLKQNFKDLVSYRLQGFTEPLWFLIDKALENFAERGEDYLITNVSKEMEELKSKYPEAEKAAYSYYYNKSYEMYSIEKIPQRFIDDDMLYSMWLGKIYKAGYPLHIVPKQYINEDMCWGYVAKGNSLAEIPFNLRTKDVCCKAIQRSGFREVQYCPEEFRLILYTCLAKKNKITYLEDVPEKYRTERFYYWMLFNKCIGIYDVPVKLWNSELWDVYTEKNYISVKTIPKEFQTPYNMLICISRGYETTDFLHLITIF